MKINPIFRYAVAASCVAYGYAAAASLPSFHMREDAVLPAQTICQIAGVLVAAFACLVQNAVVFRIGGLWWTMRHLCRHVIIIGDTGSGKTLGAQNFILREYITNFPRGGAFIVGTKGDEADYALGAAATARRTTDFKCLEVRPDDAPANWTPPNYYNFLSDRTLPWTAHAKAIVDTAAANTEGNQSSFFKPSAQKAIAYGLHVLASLKRPVNLRALHDLLASEEELRLALREFESDDARLTNTDDDRVIDFFNKEFIKPKGKDQSAGQEATASLFLAPFLTPEIAEVFCSEKTNTVELTDLDNGGILVTRIPQRFYSERQFVHTYLKTLIYYRALRRLDKPWYQKFFMNPIGVFIDEFQDAVTASEDGMADHKIADRVRGGKTFIVGSMQSELSPDPKIGEPKRKVLMKNLRTRFYFRVPDEEDAKLAADFIGKKTVVKRFRSAKGVLDLTSTGNPDEIHKVKTEKFLNLPDFVCYVVHPTPRLLGERFRRVKMPPLQPNGSVPTWYRLGAIATLLKNEN